MHLQNYHLSSFIYQLSSSFTINYHHLAEKPFVNVYRLPYSSTLWANSENKQIKFRENSENTQTPLSEHVCVHSISCLSIVTSLVDLCEPQKSSNAYQVPAYKSSLLTNMWMKLKGFNWNVAIIASFPLLKVGWYMYGWIDGPPGRLKNGLRSGKSVWHMDLPERP